MINEKGFSNNDSDKYHHAVIQYQDIISHYDV